MLSAIKGRLTYANTLSTLALFAALGGGAYAASSGLVSSSGFVQECVKSRGGIPRVVRAHARCSHGTIPLFLATPGAVTLRGARGPKGATGPRGHTGKTGATGAQGPAGAPGASGAASYSFSLARGSSNAQGIASTFGANEMRLVCGAGKCQAQVLVSGAVRAAGTDSRGEVNGTPVTKLIKSATPAQATLTEIDGEHGENVSVGAATVSLADGSGWRVEVELTNDGSGNVQLSGTAVAASATTSFTLCTLCK
jgi:hypothetical protein